MPQSVATAALPSIPQTYSLTAPTPSLSTDFVSFTNSSVSPVPNHFSIPLSTVNEPAVANFGTLVFYTGNWYYAYSLDGGITWSYGDPAKGMSLLPTQTDFCCDQDTIYNPSHQVFIWLRMGCPETLGICDTGTTDTSTNRFFVGVSTDIVNWSLFSIFPSNLTQTWSNNWFDFPILSYSSNDLYITTNLIHGDLQLGSIMLRIPLDYLTTDTPFTFKYVFDQLNTAYPIFSFAPVQGATSTMYWATHSGVASVRLYAWNEASSTSITYEIATPRFQVSGFAPLANDPHFSFVDPSASIFWKPGETVVYDATINGVFDAGDTVLYGPTPPIGTPLWHSDPYISFVQAESSGFWSPTDPFESIVYDAGFNGHYQAGDPVLKGQTPGIMATCRAPDGGDLCPRIDNRITGGWVANGVIGFSWMAGQNSTFPYPFMQMVRISESTRTVIDNPILWNSQYAWVYGWAAPDARGGLGLAAFTSGRNMYPTFNVGILDDISGAAPPFEFYRVVASAGGPPLTCGFEGATSECWGDYVRVHPFEGTGNIWIASGYVLPKCTGILCDQSTNVVPWYVVFGRLRDNPPPPPSRGWVNVGPSPIQNCYAVGLCSGRITALAYDPSHPGTIYAGAAMGGIWKTTSAGASWTPVTDNQSSLAIGSIAVDRKGVVYVGTGAGDFSCDGGYGAGILKSIDGGKKWTQLGTSVFSRSSFTRVAVNPYDPNKILVSTAGSWMAFPGSCASVAAGVPLGVYSSTDGGSTWARTFTATSYASDVVFDPIVKGSVYAGIDGGVYNSADNGTTWTGPLGQGFGGLPLPGLVARISMSISNSSSLFAGRLAVAMDVQGRGNLYDAGSSWSNLTNTLPMGPNGGSFCSPQCLTNLFVVVDPSNSAVIYLGGLDLYRTTGCCFGIVWDDLGGYAGGIHSEIHPDQHAFALNPFSQGALEYTAAVVGNDGGVWYSASVDTCIPGSCWKDINSGLSVTQFISLATDPTNSTIFFGGTQDNGTPMHKDNSGFWTQLVSGDAGWTAFDTKNSSIMYHAFYGINLQRSDDKGTTWKNIITGLNTADRATFYVPVAIDPSRPSTLYLGSYRLWKTTDRGDVWTLLSPGLQLPAPSNCYVGECISSIAVAPSNDMVVYATTTFGRIFVSTDGGTNFVEQDTGLPTSDIASQITVDPANSLRVFVTYLGFGLGHVFYSTDAGQHWMNSSANLPDVPTQSILVSATGNLFVGNNMGVYDSMDNGASWSVLSTGLPHTAVYAMALTRNGTFLAATFGRGVWALTPNRLPLHPTPPVLLSIVSGEDHGIYWSSLTSTWSSWTSLPGSTPSAPVVCSAGPGNVELVVKGTDYGIYHLSYSNGQWSSAWDSPGGATADQPACAVLGNTMYLVVRGLDNGIWFNSLPLSGGLWSGWQSLRGGTLLPPVLVPSPALNRLDLAVTGVDNGLYHKSFTGGSWSSLWDSPGGATPAIPAIASDGTSLHLVVRGMDNGIYYSQLHFGGSWTGWNGLSGATPSAPSLIIDGTGIVHLVVRGTNNQVYHKSLTAGTWSAVWDELGGSTSDRPAVSASGSVIAMEIRGATDTIQFNTLVSAKTESGTTTSWQKWITLPGTSPLPIGLASIS